jgi:hypothetical protein
MRERRVGRGLGAERRHAHVVAVRGALERSIAAHDGSS